MNQYHSPKESFYLTLPSDFGDIKLPSVKPVTDASIYDVPLSCFCFKYQAGRQFKWQILAT